MKMPKFLQWMILFILALIFTSCAGVISGLTGQKVPSTPVKRDAPEAKPVNVASADLFQAEAGPPETVYGLYDAGMVAGKVAQVVKSGK